MRRRWEKEKCPFYDRQRGILGMGFGNKGRRGIRSGRFRVDRNLPFLPVATIFKPNGVPVVDLDFIELNLDEGESLRLKNVEELNQIEAAEKMGVSQSTFARILDSANKKIGTALVNGCGIKILEK